MALMQYRVDAFSGIHQGACQNNLRPSDSPDARNMDTSGGRLAVARGYVRHIPAPTADPGSAMRLTIVSRAGGGADFVVAGSDAVYACAEGEPWRQIWTFAAPHCLASQFDFQLLKLGSTEYLIVASGTEQLMKWDGASAAGAFGSAAELSDVPVNFVELYYARLFAAGDPSHPARLYWSCAPGDGRSVEDWSSVPESENVSGGFVEVGTDSDPITGLFALSNQLVIVKKRSLYRLLGDRPSNYRVVPVFSETTARVHTACVRYGDVLYFLTEDGLNYFDGQSVHRRADGGKLTEFLKSADLSRCTGAACRDKLYFALRVGSGQRNDAIVEYDLARGCFMIRDGFTVIDMAALDQTLYILDGNGYVCRFDEGTDYAGVPIRAYWRTPETDLGSKMGVKQLRELYLRGSGGVMSVEAFSAGAGVFSERLMPAGAREVLELPLSGDGRAFSLKLSNVGGSRFTVDGGLELLIGVTRRVL